jgi:hypothetical protein
LVTISALGAGAAALLDYAESREKMPAIEYGDWPTMPMRSLSNDNYDRVWIAQGDDVLAIGVGDTPQEAAINYAAAVSELLTGERYGDAFDTKPQIREQQRHAERGDAGDGHPSEPPDYDAWSR